jgi:DNA (cytosine-5)-methyltransferase 1
MARMEDQALEPTPVWCGNLEDFFSGPWHDAVDGIIAGFPCPPVSNAGQRKGVEDERWLLPEIMRIVCEVKPRWLFLENVGGLRTANAGREFGEVLRLLSESGFDAEWLTLPASDVGAPHERDRVFFLAYRNGQRCGLCGEPIEPELPSRDEPSRSGQGFPHREELADPKERGLGIVRQSSGCEGQSDGAGQSMADSELEGPQGRGFEIPPGGGKFEPLHGERPEDAPFPPSPGDFDAWGRIVEDGSADFRAPAIKPGLRLLADGVALVVDESRADQLRCSGNGVVALQAAVALYVLDRRAGTGLGPTAVKP